MAQGQQSQWSLLKWPSRIPVTMIVTSQAPSQEPIKNPWDHRSRHLASKSVVGVTGGPTGRQANRNTATTRPTLLSRQTRGEWQRGGADGAEKGTGVRWITVEIGLADVLQQSGIECGLGWSCSRPGWQSAKWGSGALIADPLQVCGLEPLGMMTWWQQQRWEF